MKEQYLYQLKLIPSLLNEDNWTERENEIVKEHFHMLQDLCEQGIVMMAGRTLVMEESGFGIVILEVDTEEEAKEIMKSDPAVKHGVMTATLFPYRVALFRDSKR
ncbi:YciI family protein [Bacillus suaedaesalsae]|uniref:YCII-related domain-containing protein n=1 Tax=Bacillus suaedaesalsae TaxID=2810349 RepID=A0ABS2DG44_9BACI|nr:YciI family protein [Bacillus suaedaesalsae]MBM6617386.1 hypothetical protein [Bacillus suaedaesalsae]